MTIEVDRSLSTDLPTQLHTMSVDLKEGWNSSRVVILKAEDGGVVAKTANTFLYWLTNFLWFLSFLFTCFFSDSYKKENRETIDNIRNMLGPKRVADVAERYDIDLNYKHQHGVALSKRELQMIFYGMGDIRRSDLEDLVKMINSSDDRIRHLDEDKSKELRERLERRELKQLDKEEVDQLYDVLVPFNTLDDMFLQDVPEVEWKIKRDNTPAGNLVRVLMTEEMRRKLRYDPKLLDEADRELYWNVRFMKRIVDERMPQGVVIPHYNGHLEYTDLIEDWGAYKVLMKPISPNTLRPHAVYMSTRVGSPFWERMMSIRETILPAIGTDGIKRTYAKTREMFNNPAKGFIDYEGQEIEFLGMSLGGAQAMRDTCLFHNRVAKLTTVAAPGIDRQTLSWFANTINQSSRTSKMEIYAVRDKDDDVTGAGDGHLGLGCSPEKIHVRVDVITPARDRFETDSEDDETGSVVSLNSSHIEGMELGDFHGREEPPPSNPFSAFYRMFVQSLLGSHSRETTAGKYDIHRLDSEKYDDDGRAHMDAIHNEFDHRVGNRHLWDEIWRPFFMWTGGRKRDFHDFLIQTFPENSPH